MNSYSVKGQFSGWTFGLGGVLGGRLYNKTLEIHSSHKEFFHEIWQECGYDKSKAVWRLEFEFKREILQQYGLVGHLSVLDALGSLWAYATGDWLRLSIPLPEDDTRSRWPTHPLWECLSGVDWKTPPVKLQTRFKLGKLPSEKYLLNTGFSSILGFMVREEIGDFVAGSEAYLRRLTSFQTNKAFADGVPFEQYVYEKWAAAGAVDTSLSF